MKTLRLYGKKRWILGIVRKGFVADVFVGERGKRVVIEAKTRKLKRELTEAVEGLLKKNQLLYLESSSERGTHVRTGKPVGPADELFLEALKSYGPFWWGRKYGGYEIDETMSRIENNGE